MEIRKLQKIKGGSFTISLPKDWVEKRKLKRGEQMAVSQEEDGSLRIYPVSAPLEKPYEVTLTLEDYPNLRALEYCVGTYYIQGSNKINITSKQIIPAEHKKRLKLLRTRLPGVEVAEEKADRLSFQVLIDPTAFALESLIEKTSSFSLHLQEDAVKSVLEHDLQLAREVMERSKEALRHYRMTIRQVALSSLDKSIAKKVGVRDCQECVTFALIARDLNRVVYHSSSIAGHLLDLEGKKIDRRILDMIVDISKATYEMQREAVQAFLKKDVKLAIDAMGKMDEVRGKEKMLLTRVLKDVKDVDTAVSLSMITRDLRRIAGYSVAIADDAMNRVLTPTSLI
ncbi:MAG: PhoU domain-containing protein [Candidatus Bathyarchaeia archaeon]